LASVNFRKHNWLPKLFLFSKR